MNADVAMTADARARRAADEARRREIARAAAARHSRRVRRLKILLPVSGAVIVAGIGLTMLVSALTPGFDLGSVQLSSDGIVMDNPHISGHDAKNRSYEVTADRAVQSITDPKQVKLENISARINLGDGAWAAFTAGTGRYNGNNEHLSLDDRIAVETSDGYHATLKAAEIDLRGGTISSDTPIVFSSREATIKAGTLAVDENGRAIVFSDGVTMTINPGAFPRSSGAVEVPAGAPAAADPLAISPSADPSGIEPKEQP